MSQPSSNNSSVESFASAESGRTQASTTSSSRSSRHPGWTYSVLQNPGQLGIPVNDVAEYPTHTELQHRIAAARHPDSPEGWTDVHLPDAIRALHRVNT